PPLTLLQTPAAQQPMSVKGQKQTKRPVGAMSALPPQKRIFRPARASQANFRDRRRDVVETGRLGSESSQTGRTVTRRRAHLSALVECCGLLQKSACTIVVSRGVGRVS